RPNSGNDRRSRIERQLNFRRRESAVVCADLIDCAFERIVVAGKRLTRPSDSRVGVGAGSQREDTEGLLQVSIDVEQGVGRGRDNGKVCPGRPWGSEIEGQMSRIAYIDLPALEFESHVKTHRR